MNDKKVTENSIVEQSVDCVLTFLFFEFRE